MTLTAKVGKDTRSLVQLQVELTQLAENNHEALIPLVREVMERYHISEETFVERAEIIDLTFQKFLKGDKVKLHTLALIRDACLWIIKDPHNKLFEKLQQTYGETIAPEQVVAKLETLREPSQGIKKKREMIKLGGYSSRQIREIMTLLPLRYQVSSGQLRNMARGVPPHPRQLEKVYLAINILKKNAVPIIENDVLSIHQFETIIRSA